MEIIRIILSGIMALLMSVSMCVCGNSFLPIPIEEKHSCCPHQHEEEREDNSERDGHDCNLTHHDQVKYLWVNSDPTLPKAPEQNISADFNFPEKNSPVPYFTRENYLKAPPRDRFSRSSRNIIYCIYRL